MASLNEQKQACGTVVSEHMEALADFAISANRPDKVKDVLLQIVGQLTSRMTLSELQAWQAHVEAKYGHLIADDNVRK